jgi:cytoskeletal protein CcmA (bactofilin family)
MKKMLLLAAVAAMGVGYGSEDGEKERGSEYGISPLSVSESEENDGHKKTALITECIFLLSDAGKYKILEKYKASVGKLHVDKELDTNGQTPENVANKAMKKYYLEFCPETDDERDFMKNAKKYILHGNDVRNDVTDCLLSGDMSGNALLEGPAIIEGSETEINYRAGDGTSMTGSPKQTFSSVVVDGSANVSKLCVVEDLIVIGDCILSGKVTIGRYLFVLGTITVSAGTDLTVENFILPGNAVFVIYGNLIIGGSGEQQTTQTPGTYILKNETNGMTTIVEIHDGGKIIYGPGITVVEFSPTVAEAVNALQ